MAGRQYFKLDPSETAILQSATNIFSAYLSSGQVKDGEEARFLEKSISISLALARKLEDLIQSDTETGHGG